MPVIGRLDDQVNEVLIKPLSRSQEADASREPAPQTAPAQNPDEVEGRQAAPADKSEEGELPVWLL